MSDTKIRCWQVNFVFSCTQGVKAILLREGTDMKYGARHLRRVIERNVVFPLADLMATGQVNLGDFIRIDCVSSGEMTFVKEAEGALPPVLLERYGPDSWGHIPVSNSRGAGAAAPLSVWVRIRTPAL